MMIYLTTNLITGKQYVGQTTNIRKDYIGSGLLIQKAIKKYGKENFKRETLIECSSQEELNEQEEFWIAVLNTLQPNGYNIQFGGSNGSGYKLSEDARHNISIGHKGRKHTEETKKKISKGNKGKIISNETRKKISISLSGENHPYYNQKFSDEHKKKIIESRRGYKPSEETKKKISISKKGSTPWNKGKVDIYTAETLEKMKKSKSKEHKKKLSKAHKGMKKPWVSKANKQRSKNNDK